MSFINSVIASIKGEVYTPPPPAPNPSGAIPSTRGTAEAVTVSRTAASTTKKQGLTTQSKPNASKGPTNGSESTPQGSSKSLVQAKKATDGKGIKPVKHVTAKDGQPNMATPTSGRKRKAEAELQRGVKKVVKTESKAAVSTTTTTTPKSAKTVETEAPKSAHRAQAHDAALTLGQKRKAGDEMQSGKEKLATKDPKNGMSTPSGNDKVQSEMEKAANKDLEKKLGKTNSKDVVSMPSGTLHKAPKNTDGAASTQGDQSSKERPGSGQKRKAKDSLQHVATKVARVAEEIKDGAKVTSPTAKVTSQAGGGAKVTGVAKTKVVRTEASVAIGENSTASQSTVDPTEPIASPGEPAPRRGWYAETLAKGARARAAWEAKMRRDAETKKDNLSWCLRQAFHIPGKMTRDLTEWEAARRRQDTTKKSRSSSRTSRRGSASSADPSKSTRAQELSRPSSRNSATRPKTKDAAAATTLPGSVVSSKAYRGPVEKEYKGTARVPVRKPEPVGMAAPVVKKKKKEEAAAKEVVAPHKTRRLIQGRRPSPKRKVVTDHGAESDGSSDMEAGAHELEEEESTSLKVAVKEDEEALREEISHKTDKERRRLALQQLAAKRALKR